MENILNLIQEHLEKSIIQPKILASKHNDVDYCLNNLIPIAKSENKSVDYIKKCILDSTNNNNMYSVNISKNYINFNLKKEFMAECINSLQEELIQKTNKKLKIIIDYSSPNIAKDMHVGHLRSTIIGDSLANLYEMIGHEVIRINHIGDFGLQFGMIIQYIIDNKLENSLTEEKEYNLQKIYIAAKKSYDSDSDFKKQAHIVTVALQTGINSGSDSKIIKIWKDICDISKTAYYDIYNKLQVKSMIEMGESFYVKFFDSLKEELDKKNLLEFVDGRYIIPTFIDNKNGALTIIKSDGGYTYDTTDLAAIRYRLIDLKADIVYYVVDSGQSLHFKQIFYVAEKAGWLKENQKLEHINFGIVKGINGKRIRSRVGENPKLIDLLNDAVDETKKVMIDYNPNLDNDAINSIAYGSIKYADMAICRSADYVYSYDRMLSFKGNSMIYIMYSYVRCRSILRNVAKIVDITFNFKINANDLNEGDSSLMKYILRLPEILELSTSENTLNHICEYLYKISDLINNLYKSQRCISFIDDVPISINYSRITIFKRLSQVIEFCFKIIGINPIQEM